MSRPPEPVQDSSIPPSFNCFSIMSALQGAPEGHGAELLGVSGRGQGRLLCGRGGRGGHGDCVLCDRQSRRMGRCGLTECRQTVALKLFLKI